MNKIVSFTDMLKNHTGSVYVFQEEHTGNLFFKTTDIRELQKCATSQTIAIGEPISIDGVDYTVKFIEIEVSTFSPTLSRLDNQRGENNPFGITTVIYIGEADRK